MVHQRPAADTMTEAGHGLTARPVLSLAARENKHLISSDRRRRTAQRGLADDSI